MKPTDVLVIGRGCLDMIAVVDRFPAENQKVPLASRLMEGGGQGATSACCISRLGGKGIYVGCLGDDGEGRFCLERLKAFQVETAHLSIIPGGRTPVAYIFVTRASGARTILYEPNTLPRVRMTPELRTLASKAPVILLDPETTYLAQDLRPFQHTGTQIVYDCERWREGIKTMMEVADYFIPTSDFLQSPQLALADAPLPDQMFELKRRIHGELIVINGEDGAYCVSENRILHCPAPPVHVADTTGAGDNFHASFALAISRSLDWTEAVRLATAAASLSCREYGGRNGIPHWDEAMATAEGLELLTVATRSG